MEALYSPVPISECLLPLEGFEEKALFNKTDCQGKSIAIHPIDQLRQLVGSDAWACGVVLGGVETVLWNCFQFRHTDGTYNFDRSSASYRASEARLQEHQARTRVIEDVKGQLLDKLRETGDHVWVVMFGTESYRLQYTLNEAGGLDRAGTKRLPWALYVVDPVIERACAEFHAVECCLDAQDLGEAHTILDGLRTHQLPGWHDARLKGRLHNLILELVERVSGVAGMGVLA